MSTLRMGYSTFQTQAKGIGLIVYWSKSGGFFRAIAIPAAGVEFLFEAEDMPATFNTDFPLATQVDEIYAKGA